VCIHPLFPAFLCTLQVKYPLGFRIFVVLILGEHAVQGKLVLGPDLDRHLS